MTTPTPEWRAWLRRNADEDGYAELGVYELHDLLDALDAAEAKIARVEAVIEKWDLDRDRYHVQQQALEIIDELRAWALLDPDCVSSGMSPLDANP